MYRSFGFRMTGNLRVEMFGKIDSITRTPGSTRSDIRYRYDASGNRICKIVIPRPSGTPQKEEFWTYTYYVRDAQGNVISIYDRDITLAGQNLDDKIIGKEHHLYGSSFRRENTLK